MYLRAHRRLALPRAARGAPEKRDEVAEARRLGGLRWLKERTVAAAFDLGRPCVARRPKQPITAS